jgi:hypothetical protein
MKFDQRRKVGSRNALVVQGANGFFHKTREVLAVFVGHCVPFIAICG